MESKVSSMFNEVLSDYQLDQVVEQWKDRFEDKDRGGLQNDVPSPTVQPLDLADSPRELHYTQLPGKQQVLFHQCYHRSLSLDPIQVS